MKKLSYKQLLELPPRTPLGAQDFYNAAENQISVEYDFDKHCFVGSSSSKMILSAFYIEYFLHHSCNEHQDDERKLLAR